jgi:hypothetical protein
MSVGVQMSAERSLLHASPIFQPVEGESREAALARARDHFQSFLRQVEAILRQQPCLWFNFTPFNPLAPAGSA